MKTLNTAAFLVFFLLVAPLSAAELNVGVVSLARLLAEAPQARQSFEQLQNEFKPREDALRLRDEEISKETRELREQISIMSESEMQDAKLQLGEKQRDLGRKRESFLSDFNRRRNAVLGALQKSLMSEVNKFATLNNYDLIIGEGVLFASASVDVTSQMLTSLHASFQQPD